MYYCGFCGRNQSASYDPKKVLKSGVDRYKVIIDATTTTQADVENNTLRGKIFIQPTRTAEFVALDFTLTNAGDAFDQA